MEGKQREVHMPVKVLQISKQVFPGHFLELGGTGGLGRVRPVG